VTAEAARIRCLSASKLTQASKAMRGRNALRKELVQVNDRPVPQGS